MKKRIKLNRQCLTEERETTIVSLQKGRLQEFEENVCRNLKRMCARNLGKDIILYRCDVHTK